MELASEDPVANPSEQSELLSFRVGESEYSVDIMSVREIRGWTRATSLPHSPSYVHGVINLRGTVLPVIDLERRLGLGSNEPNERSVIIVVDHDGRTVGMRVDAVSDILTVSRTAIQPPPEIADNTSEGFVEGLIIIDERMVRVLNLAAIMPPETEAVA